jgi:hypothetical protein
MQSLVEFRPARIQVLMAIEGFRHFEITIFTSSLVDLHCGDVGV